MKKMEITINVDGEVGIDLQEGFSGMSCVEKSRQLEILIGGEQVSQDVKPEYYSDETVDIGIDIQF